MRSTQAGPIRAPDVRAHRIGDTIYVARDPDEYELTEVGGLVWSLLDGSRSLDELASIVGRELGLADDQAHAETEAFVEQLLEVGFASWSNGATATLVAKPARSVVPPPLERLLAVPDIPERHVCIYVSGSVVTGSAHANSDIDMFVVTDQSVRLGRGEGRFPGVAADALPAIVPVLVAFVEQWRLDVEFWTEAQVLERISKFERGRYDEVLVLGAPPFSDWDVQFVNRLLTGKALSGGEWLASVREKILDSDFQWMVVERYISEADNNLDDAVGHLEAGQPEAASLAARIAFGAVVDALTVDRGSYSLRARLRPQRVRERLGDLLPWEEYWAWETMRDLEVADVDAWVLELVSRCRDLILTIRQPAP